MSVKSAGLAPKALQRSSPLSLQGCQILQFCRSQCCLRNMHKVFFFHHCLMHQTILRQLCHSQLVYEINAAYTCHCLCTKRETFLTVQFHFVTVVSRCNFQLPSRRLGYNGCSRTEHAILCQIIGQNCPNYSTIASKTAVQSVSRQSVSHVSCNEARASLQEGTACCHATLY